MQRALDKIDIEHKIVTHPYEGDNYEDHALIKVMKYPNVLMKSPLPNQAVSRTPGFMRTGCFKEKTEVEPAIQSDKDERFDPSKRHFMSVSLNKDNGDTIPYIDPKEESVIKAFIKDTIKENWNWTTARFYTVDQAVNGVRKVGSRPIDIHSSAGLPYKLRPGVEGKQPFIRWSDEQQRYIIKEEVYNAVEFKEDLFRNGIVSTDFKLSANLSI